jgi:hypothetical protein
VVYGITIAPLLATLGFYFLEHVPSREEYFLNLRFRTLGVIGKQIETKLEAVSSGLTYGRSIPRIDQAQANAQPHRLTLTEYVGRIFPGLQSPEGQAQEAAKPGADSSAIAPAIEFLQSADRVRFTVGPADPRWEDSLSHLIRPLTEDASFDDVLLADQKGVVLFQRSDSTPRVRDVSGILKKPDAKDSGFLQIFHRLHSEGSGSDTDLLRDVDLDGSGFRFLTQPLTVRVPRSSSGSVKELLLCGLVRSATIRNEAMHVPPKYLLWIIVPLFAGVLSGPLLKLMLMRRTGRFQTRDLPLLALFSCLAMAMLTVVLLAFHLSERNSQRLEESSKGLADRLTAQVLECFRRGREALEQADAFAVRLDASKPTPPVALNRTRLWSWPELVRQAPAVTETSLEFIFWTSADGFQIEKWTPLETNTPFYPQRSSAHYQQAVAGQYWHARNDADSPFTVELLISPTTSTPITVLTMPSKRNTEFRIDPDRRAVDPGAPQSLKPAFVSVVETPRNLLSPVIPPATGFALVQRDGSVLYHSDHDRILNENLFRETENFRTLAEAVAMQSEGRVEGRYRGNNVAFYVRPIREVAGIPWTIVVFREIEQWQTLVWQVGLDVLVLYLLLWAVPVLAVPAALLAMKWRRKNSWNACRIAVLREFWPKAHAARIYRTVAAIEAGLVVAFLGLLAWFGKAPDGAAGTVLLVGALLLPGIALSAWAWQVGRLPEQPPARPAMGRGSRWRPVYVAALCITLLSSSVLPVTAFFYLAFRMESEIDTRHWQGDLADRVLKHRAGMEAEIRQPERLAPESVAMALNLALPGPETGLCDSERLYESWSQTTIRCGAVALPDPAVPLWNRVLRSLRVRGIGLDSASVPVGKFEGVTRTGVSQPVLAISRVGAPDLVVQSSLWNLPLVPRSAGWWILAALLLVAGCVWVWSAASRLFLFDFHEIPLRTLEQLRECDLNHPILVLGLPRSGKDGAVREFINSVESVAGRKAKAVQARIDLKSDSIDESWLKQVLHDIGLETFSHPPAVDIRPVAQLTATAVVGGSVPITPELVRQQPAGSNEPGSEAAAAECRIPDYVHVTNLEAAIQERGRRDIAMRLLDVLVRAHATGRLRLLVTSVVDPMFHFDIIFPDQNEAVESSQLPETEFGRWVHVFLQFERVLVQEKKSEVIAAEHACRKGSWGNDLWEECRHHRSLRRFGEMITDAIEQRIAAGQPSPTHQELIDELYEKALALYKLLWSACTRPEKLLLVQLAQTGLVNPMCKDTLHDLIRKRLVLLKPHPSVMNESFTRFLQSAATSEQILNWEREAGESHWHTIRNVLVIMVAFAFLMIGMSQDRALQSISGILTAVVGGIGGAFKLVETISSKMARKSESAAGEGAA